MANAVVHSRRRLRNQWTRLRSKGNDTPQEATQRSPSATFADSIALKDRLREVLAERRYSVHDFYHETGISQRIARHPFFEAATHLVVVMNSIWIAIEMDFNTSDVLATAAPVFRHAEHFFTIFFTCEWFVRFCAFKRKRSGFRDGWFLFDTALVMFMALEDFVVDALIAVAGGTAGNFTVRQFSVIRLARLLRLTRIARMGRLFKMVPELLILIRGLMTAMRSVVATLGLLLIMLYIFALVFRQVNMGVPVLRELYFSSVPMSMYTLLIEGVFMDSVGNFVRHLGHYSVANAVLFWTFVLTSSLTVMNMMIAVVCDSVGAVAASEKEAIQVRFVNEKMQALIFEMDSTGDGRISQEEFLTVLGKPEAAQLLHDAGIDVIALVDHVDGIFAAESLEGAAEQTLSFDELMEIVLSLRSSCTATVKDIIDLRKFTRSIVAQTNDHLTRIEGKLHQLHSGVTDSKPPLSAGPHSEQPALPQMALGSSPPRSKDTSELLARARNLGTKLKGAQKAGEDAPHLAFRAEELRRAYKALKDRPADPRVKDAEYDRPVPTG